MSDLGEEVFFKLLKGGFLWGTQKTCFWGEFWEVLGGSHFFHPKVGFWKFIESGKSLEDL